MNPLTRRTVLASLATTLAAGASPPVAAVPLATPLYVNHQWGGLLSFGKPYDDFSGMPEWTWRRQIARDAMGDPLAELDSAALESARAEFADRTDVEADDWDEQAFLQWLDDPLPLDDALEALEQWMSTEGAPGQAAQLIDMLSIVTPEDGDFRDGICIQEFPWFGVMVGEQGLDHLKNAIAARGLQIEIIETS